MESGQNLFIHKVWIRVSLETRATAIWRMRIITKRMW